MSSVNPPMMGSAALGVWSALVLFMLGVAVAALLLHALRKVRSQDWVVALCWGGGGALAVGTGLWLLQLLSWRETLPQATPWFHLGPFLASWCVAMAGASLAVVAGRWHGRFVNLPIPLVTASRNQVDPSGDLWLSVLEATGQPVHL